MAATHAAAATVTGQPTVRTVGFVGLGLMGRPMAANLVHAGFLVRPWARRPDALVDDPVLGPLAIADLPAVGAGADAILTMLPDMPDVQGVIDGGLLGALSPGGILVVMGTVAPAGVRRLGERLAAEGFALVDAPVSGGVVGAERAELSIMMGGDETVVERLAPVMAAMGRKVRRMGPLGAGQVAKACNQVVVATTLTSLAEAAVLAAANGIDTAALFDVLSGGLAGSRALDVKGPKIAARDFTPGGAARFQLKDLDIALAEARAVGIPLPVTAIVQQLYQALVARGHGRDDHCGIIQVIEALAGPRLS